MIIEVFLYVTMPLLAIWANGEYMKGPDNETKHRNRPSDTAGDRPTETGDQDPVERSDREI
jgi:hypothetical protein